MCIRDRHKTAYKTSGGLTEAQLMFNKHGRIVSKKKHNTAKKEKRLEKAGYKPKKGKFVLMRKSMRNNKTHKRKNKHSNKTHKKHNSSGHCHNSKGRFTKC